MPTFESIESIFARTPSASFFPSYEVPQDLPPSAQLLRMARNVFPYWKSRKEIRKGRAIVPQLNVSQRCFSNFARPGAGLVQAQMLIVLHLGTLQLDEANENDPYLCFRRRENKPPRKTRNKDTTSVDRMQKIQFELKQAQTLVSLVLSREREKKMAALADKDVWEARLALLDVKRKYPQLAISAEEETLLFPERTAVFPSVPRVSISGPPPAKKQRVQYAEREKEEPARSITVPSGGAPRMPRSRAQSPIAEKIPPEQLAGMFAERVEREMKRKREMDRQWEDSTNASYQPMPTTSAMRYFRCIPPSDSYTQKTDDDGLSLEDSSDMPIIPSNHQMCFRLRRGRGGSFRLDRKMPSVHRYRKGGSGTDLAEQALPVDALMYPSMMGDDADETMRDRARMLSERWRYDGMNGKSGVNLGVADEDQVVIDDFEPK